MKSFKRKTKIFLLLALLSGLTSIFFTNCGQVGFKAAGPGSAEEDPYFGLAWHLSNSGQKAFSQNSSKAGVDLNLQQSWLSGLSGKGIRILISDDGVEDTHEDLAQNYLYGTLSKDYTKSSPFLANSSGPITAQDNHGTAVAGLIAAAAVNGVGSRGVAPLSSIISANFLSSAVTQSESALVDQASGDFDIFNMSWGSQQNNLVSTVASFQAQLAAGATSGRNGKGSIFVKAAGNDFFVLCKGSTTEYCIGNSNFDGDNVSPYVIMVAALNSIGEAATYSSPGANLWVSSFGGEFGYDYPAMITTDRTGCTNGFAASNTEGSVSFERGTGNSGCKYTATFNGTSAAAPVLSGAIALILQANPRLTWRDIKYILAKTAVPVNYVTTGLIPHPKEATPTGAIWEQVWIENKAGFKFHNWYGFGRVDVDQAVTMARSYTSAFGSLQNTNWAHDSSVISVAIPDSSATGATHSIVVNADIKIEATQIKIWATHPNISDLGIEVTSPSGTKSIVINMNNAVRGVADYVGDVFLTNAFYGESTQGVWTIKVIDGKTSNTGTLTRWSLNFLGAN